MSPIKVAAIALAITCGPIGWGYIARSIFRFLWEQGVSFEVANYVTIMFITFPFFFWAVWVLCNMDRWSAFLKKITG